MMAFNSSRLTDSWSPLFLVWKSSNRTSVYYQVTLTTCVVTSLLAPMAAVGNVLILTAIWRNPSLRTPSYVFLAGLAFTDFCTGLLSQPCFVMFLLAALTGNIKLFCIGGQITGIIGYYFSSLTGIVMTIIAVERWLHMSRRSLLTVRRVVVLYITFAVFVVLMGATRINRRVLSVFAFLFLLSAAICVVVTAFTYFKVFRIIRHHQSQVQTNAVNIEKYKKSIFTIVYIFAVFALSYIPYLCYMLALFVSQDYEESFFAAFIVCAAVVFSSSFENPLLYYWRIKKIRDSAKAMVKTLCCKCKEHAEE